MDVPPFSLPPPIPFFMPSPAQLRREQTTSQEDLMQLEPFKRQVSWACPIEEPPMSCSICGGKVGDGGFHPLCELRQRRMVLERILEDSHKTLIDAYALAADTERALASNKKSIDEWLPISPGCLPPSPPSSVPQSE